MKFFSVITICKDNLGELKNTGQSIFSQSFKDFEWIVIDGNSSDGTRDWLASLINVNWISEPDKGIYDAMNKGIRKAEGKYLIFMNSGDRFSSNAVLDDSYKFLATNNLPVFAYGDSIDVAEDGGEHYRVAKNYNKNWLGMITQHQAMFFNKLKIQPFKYLHEYPLSGDYALISKVLKEADPKEILQLRFPICKFNMGGVNETKRFRAIKEDFFIRKNIIKLPLILNLLLLGLHYLHSFVKKAAPSARFVRHKNHKKTN
jgi:putative colanic acid biosynthesis glycosyltransferase